MTEPTTAEIAVRDPLTAVTRNERRFLLGVSIISIALVKTGLVPTKISALGIEFSETNQKSILSILALVVLYFLIAFTIYAISDFLAWRLAFRSAAIAFRERQMRRARAKREGADEDEIVRLGPEGWQGLPGSLAHRLGGSAFLLRATFEFLLPIIVGLYTVILLWRTPAPLQDPSKHAQLIPSVTMRSNKSPEPTAVGACRSAVAVHVASRRWLSFLR